MARAPPDNLHVAWPVVCVLRNGAALGRVEPAEQRTAWTTFIQGALTNQLNPKAYLFMLAVFPQFLESEGGGSGSRPPF